MVKNIFLTFFNILLILKLANGLDNLVDKVSKSKFSTMNLPEICTTLRTEEGSELAQRGEPPYEILIQRVAPGVYEVIIQGKSDESFTDFILSLTAPYAGQFSSENFETFGCFSEVPTRVTLIRARKSDRSIRKRQIVSHFYPLNGSKNVHFRGSVYHNKTTFWIVTNRNTQLPAFS